MTRPGFTLIELIVVFGVLLTLFAVTSVNLLNSQRRSSQSSAISSLVADLKSQQTKAMSGDTEGRATTDHYGLYIQASSYTLFHGSGYSSSDSANVVINTNDNIQFSTTFPSSSLIFTKGSGEILNFVSGSNTISVIDPSGSPTKVIQFNKYGVIIQIN